MSLPVSSSAPAASGFRHVPYVPCGLAAALVVLRLVIGWHFFQEGSKKLAYNPLTGETRIAFTAEPMLKSAVGPLAPTIKASLPNVHEWERLLAAPRKAGQLDGAKRDAWEREYAKRFAAADPDSPGSVEFNPDSASAAWAKRIAADWRAAAVRFKGLAGVTAEQGQAADAALARRLAQLREYLTAEEQSIGEWQHELWRLAQWEAAPSGRDLPYEQVRIVEKRAETSGASAAWVAQVRQLEQALIADWRGLLDDQQAADGQFVARFDAAVSDPQERDLRKLNIAVTWLVTGVGVCLLVGLFTRLAAMAGIAFLAAVIATQPPWVPGAITTVFYYQLVEIAALGVLLVSGAGRWAGLDFFIRSMSRGCCPRAEKVAP